MKIKFLDQSEILFDNGMKITCDYEQECCEYNYADTKQDTENYQKKLQKDVDKKA